MGQAVFKEKDLPMIILNNGNPKTVILNGLKIKFNKGESTQPDNKDIALFVKKHPELSIVEKKEVIISNDKTEETKLPDTDVTEQPESKKRRRRRE